MVIPFLSILTLLPSGFEYFYAYIFYLVYKWLYTLYTWRKMNYSCDIRSYTFAKITYHFSKYWALIKSKLRMEYSIVLSQTSLILGIKIK